MYRIYNPAYTYKFQLYPAEITKHDAIFIVFFKFLIEIAGGVGINQFLLKMHFNVWFVCVAESDHTYHQGYILPLIWAHFIYIPLQPIKDEADSQRKAESQEIQQKQQQIFQEQQLMKQQQGQQIIQQQQIR